MYVYIYMYIIVFNVRIFYKFIYHIFLRLSYFVNIIFYKNYIILCAGDRIELLNRKRNKLQITSCPKFKFDNMITMYLFI